MTIRAEPWLRYPVCDFDCSVTPDFSVSVIAMQVLRSE